MRSSVKNVIDHLLVLSKDDLDKDYIINEISISERLYSIIRTWIIKDKINKYMYLNKKNGHIQEYTLNFSIRKAYFVEKEYFKLLSRGAIGNSKYRKDQDYLNANTPTMNDMFRFICMKYPNEIYKVVYIKNEPINF